MEVRKVQGLMLVASVSSFYGFMFLVTMYAAGLITVLAPIAAVVAAARRCSRWRFAGTNGGKQDDLSESKC